MAQAEQITVVIVDDHEMVRLGIAELLGLQDDFEVVGEAETAAEGLAAVRATRPRVVLLDVRLPDRSGVSVCRALRREAHPPAVLMLTSYPDSEAAAAAADAGASGYLLKDVHTDALLDALRRVAGGEVLSQSDSEPPRTPAVPPVHAPGWDRLTPQERRVLLGIGDGLTNKQIAAALFLSERTVEHYEGAMLAKLGLERRTQAVAYVTRMDRRPDH